MTVGKTTTTTIDRSNQPSTLSLLKSGKKGDIEQALYNMRISAAKGSGEAMSDWVGNKKYAGDVDLIMKHGLQNVIITGGKVTLKEGYKASLKGNANNILPLDVNSVKDKGVSEFASYEDGIFTDHCEAILSTGYSLFVDDFQVTSLILDFIFHLV